MSLTLISFKEEKHTKTHYVTRKTGRLCSKVCVIVLQRLTAFTLRVLGQVAKYVKQDQNSICNSLLWLVEKRQLENGSFQENSEYMPIKLQVRQSNV